MSGFVFFLPQEVGDLGDPVALEQAWLFCSTVGIGDIIQPVATEESRATCITWGLRPWG